MRRLWRAICCFLILTAGTRSAVADEKGDALVKQVEEHIAAIEPIVVEASTIYRLGAGSYSFVRRFCKTSNMGRNEMPTGEWKVAGNFPADLCNLNWTSAFDPLPTPPDPNFQVTSTRYCGKEIVDGVTYEVVEVTGTISDPWNGHPPLGQIMLTEAAVKWYIGDDLLIHRMRCMPNVKQVVFNAGERKITNRLVPNAQAGGDVFSVEVVTTGFRKAELIPARPEITLQGRTIPRPLDGRFIPIFALSSDSSLLAVTTIEGNVEILDFHTGEKKFQLIGVSARRIAFSPDLSIVATEGNDQVIRIWNLKTEKLLHTANDNISSMGSLTFSPDGKLLAVTGIDALVTMLDVATGEKLKMPATMQGAEVVFSPNGKLLATLKAGDGIRMWDTTTWQIIHHLDMPVDRQPTKLIFSADNQTLITSTEMGALTLWDVSAGKKLRDIDGSVGPICAFALSANGNTLIAADVDTRGDIPLRQRGLTFWDTTTWKVKQSRSFVHAESIVYADPMLWLSPINIILTDKTLIGSDSQRNIRIIDLPH